MYVSGYEGPVTPPGSLSSLLPSLLEDDPELLDPGEGGLGLLETMPHLSFPPIDEGFLSLGDKEFLVVTVGINLGGCG